MLFHELYSSYFNAVAAILRRASDAPVSDRALSAIVMEEAFGESITTIPDALKQQRWPLLDGQGRSLLRHAPTMPLTLLEKRWLKALLLDPRIALFAPDAAGLEDIQPLYTPDMVVYFDRYNDGDDFTDPAYIERFHTILTALRERRKLRLRFHGHRGNRLSWVCIPRRLEYSEKDDKFRLICHMGNKRVNVNLGRLRSAELLGPFTAEELQEEPPQAALTLRITDERNALERVMLHFSHLEKETERLDKTHYRMTLRYDPEDETEMVIRVLSFGPMVKVTEPERFVRLIKNRLEKQKNCGLAE